MREVCNLYHSHVLVSPHPRPTRSPHAVTGTFWEVMAGGHWPVRPGGIWHIMTYSILFKDAAWWAGENSLITWKFDRMNMIECCFSLSPMIFYANLPSESLTQPELHTFRTDSLASRPTFWTLAIPPATQRLDISNKSWRCSFQNHHFLVVQDPAPCADFSCQLGFGIGPKWSKLVQTAVLKDAKIAKCLARLSQSYFWSLTAFDLPQGWFFAPGCTSTKLCDNGRGDPWHNILIPKDPFQWWFHAAGLKQRFDSHEWYHLPEHDTVRVLHRFTPRACNIKNDWSRELTSITQKFLQKLRNTDLEAVFSGCQHDPTGVNF